VTAIGFFSKSKIGVVQSPCLVPFLKYNHEISIFKSFLFGAEETGDEARGKMASGHVTVDFGISEAPIFEVPS